VLFDASTWLSGGYNEAACGTNDLAGDPRTSERPSLGIAPRAYENLDFMFLMMLGSVETANIHFAS
jgi:hypothetical protein